MRLIGIILATGLFAFSVPLLLRKKDAVISLSLAGLVAAIALSMVLFPEPSFNAAERGIKVWWDIVLPALLPFFIAAELLMSLGVVHFMGVLMEPIMRPLFNVPGTGSFVLAMGLASGYPLGAALSARLKDSGMASKTEAERLMCFSNTSDPLFMTGAVAIGMFKRKDIAGIILAAHYISALLVGLALRFWRLGRDSSPPIEQQGQGFIVVRALKTMRAAQRKNPKPFGELLGDAVKKSVNTLLIILGFIVLFSVIFELMKLSGAIAILSSVISHLAPKALFPPELHEALLSGFFEITIGTSAASQAESLLPYKVAACSAIIAWSGLSVHAQVAAVIQGSGLSVWPYTATRAFQGVLAAVLTLLLMNPSSPRWAVPVFEPVIVTGPLAWFSNLGASMGLCLVITGGVFAVSLAGLIVHCAGRNLRR
ncbi:MAG: sporulation integral membrane protein YlbJ [Firmicutes bacterium]|nr:sporulation integral membrane protein YlbJ [Candidatus Fermentithermobacillaceae bacterium]